MLRACPHHGFTELTQVDTFYNGLNENDQDSLNAAAGGNLLSKTTREALNIIENKSKVRYSREDLIECINKAMAFLSAVASRFPPSNNQLRTSSNPRNQATIQDGRVTVQQVQGRQTQSYAGTGNRGISTTLKGNYRVGQPRVVKCYNCQGEGHMVRQCTQPKRPRNTAWFKEKLMLAEAQKAGQILDETEDLDAYDLDCDDLSSAKAVLMANLSSCDPEFLSEVPYSDSYPNDMINQDVQEMQYSEQTHIDDFQDNEIHSDSNIILYSQYLQESQDAVIQDTNSSTPNDLWVLSLVEQMTDHVAHLDKKNQTNKMVNESLIAELERYKELVFIFEQRQNVDLNKRKKLIDSQMDDLIWNRNAKLVAFQYVIAKEHAVISVIDDEETLILEESSRSTMPEKQNDPILIEKNRCSLDKNIFEIQIKQLRIDNDQLLNQIMSQEIVHIVANFVDILNVKKSSVNNCNKCLELEMELFKKKYFIEKRFTNNLLWKLVAITSINKDKRVRFVEPVT
ncbi:retrotransposon protein, putative, unclassified [Tanacetum coccineum]